ncbi:RHS domain-containing protein, partial [Streptomyces sp. TRM76130]|nr:RHS domain-containing protein [Streptomyces sp. TRM76130]
DERFYAIVTDLVGTPTELVDDTGTIAWRPHTTLWGTTTWDHTSTAYTPLRFPGQYFDAETELHHNYFRHYDPETARYLTADPLGLAPADNPASYVHNPHTWTDPLGLSPYQEFHTVQGRGDAERLRNGGEPWPTEDIRGQYGEGVYSWGSEDEAVRYAERLRNRGADVEILKFKVKDSDFDGLRKADIVNMPPSDAEAFMDRHSRLYGSGEPHEYEYIRGHTGMGDEHFFSRQVFHLLEFLD